MRIGIDARTMTASRPHGTGRNLLDAYREIPALRPTAQFVLFHQRPLADVDRQRATQPWDFANVALRRIEIPGDRFDAWFQLRMPLAARQESLDLVHFPANLAPAWCPVPFVLTVHDLIPLKLPGEQSDRATGAFRRGLLRGVRRAIRIITPSNATKQTLVREYGVSPGRISVIPWAPDAHVIEAIQHVSEADIERVRTTYDLAARWLISFSGSTRRKNARGAIDGFARVAPSIRRSVQLLLVGCEPESYRRTLAAQAERAGVSDQCRIVGFVPHRELPALLRGSCGLLMPSLLEGFGLPILDAFAAGVPVLTSNVSSMPEVAGGAAAYCDPNDSGTIAAGIEQILEPTVAAQLVAKGRERLDQFSWRRTAEAMCGVYESAIASVHAPRVAVSDLTEGRWR